MLEITRGQILLILAGVLAVTTMVVGIYGLVRQPETQASAGDDVALVVVKPIDASRKSAVVEDRSLPHTTDPIDYARAVAASLFDWDTTSGLLPNDYSAAVLADADPSGEETPGLLTDVATYLPTVEQWLDLATMEVTQPLSSTRRSSRSHGPQHSNRHAANCAPVRPRSPSPEPATAKGPGTVNQPRRPTPPRSLSSSPAHPRSSAATSFASPSSTTRCGDAAMGMRILVVGVATGTLLAPGVAVIGVATLVSPAAAGFRSCLIDAAATGSLGVTGDVPASLSAANSHGEQVTLNQRQLQRAATIIAVGRAAHVPARGQLIALVAALTESSLRVLSNVSAHPDSADMSNDGDSLGLFQMRPSTGWGTVRHLMDPVWSSRAFYGGANGPNHGSPRGLLDIPDWETLELGEAAQAVEVSAYPDRYAVNQPVAEAILSSSSFRPSRRR